MSQWSLKVCPHCDWKLREEEVEDKTFLRCTICSGLFENSQELSLVTRNPQTTHEFDIVDVSEAKIPSWKVLFSLFGMPVEEEPYAVPTTPFVSFFFVIACVAIHFFFPRLREAFLLYPAQPFSQFGFHLFSYSLVHADISHLLGNIFFFIPFLDNIEHKLGHLNCFIFIVCAAVGAGLLHLFFQKSGLPLAGASGVCFAVATYYALSFKKNNLLIMLPFVGILAFHKRIRIKAWTLIVFYIVLELLGAFGSTSGMSRVSHFGHLGGALIGFLLYFISEDAPTSSRVNRR